MVVAQAPVRPQLRPVLVAVAVSAVLQTLCALFISSPGGDAAAQDAWAEFARSYPGSAYNLAWYGGMHPVSYSVIAPFVMAGLGVRTTMVLTSVVGAALLTWLVTFRINRGRAGIVLAVLGSLALLGNAVSGRVTFALGTTVALAAVCVVVAWPHRPGADPVRTRRLRGVLTVLLAAVSTMCSPVSGLFLGVVAATLFLRGRRAASFAIGLPPVIIVLGSAVLFPFSGLQPMAARSVVLPLLMGLAAVALVPREWREVRIGAVVYLAMVIFAWVVPTPIGSNVTRLALLFGGVVLAAVALSGRLAGSWTARKLGRPAAVVLLTCGIVTSLGWQIGVAGADAIRSRPPKTLVADVDPLVAELQSRGVTAGRVEVVPTRSHLEAAALAPTVPLARGWNRQADVQRNPLFYDHTLTATSYRAWLERWAVRYVVIATEAAPDAGGLDEAALVSGGLPYLRPVWSDRSWKLYAVNNPTSMVQPTATVDSFTADEITVTIPAAGRYVIKVASSPWLSLVDETGAPTHLGCLNDLQTDTGQVEGEVDNWVVLRAPSAGTYRIASPYRLPRGSSCTP